MKGFYIEVTNNLLDPKHVNAMGKSVWLFMWLLDKMTSISENGKGIVLGGKPIKYSEIKEDLGLSIATYRRHISQLKRHCYIDIRRTPYGLIIIVNKARKRWGNRCIKNDTPLVEEKIKNDTSNNTVSNINSSNMSKTGFDESLEINKLLKDPKRHIQIIGLWIREKSIPVENHDQLQSIIKRNAKAAVLLKGYSDEDIKETIRVLKKTDFIKKFTLETVGKFIEDTRTVIKNNNHKRIVSWEKIEKDGQIKMRPIYIHF